MATIIGLGGSLRQGSFNGALLRAASAMAPAECPIEIVSYREFPLYDADLDAAGAPQAVRLLKDRIAAADGLLLVTPEYNGSLPGVLKNAIDWLSRPGADITRIFQGRPVAVAGASSGAGATRMAQAAWLPVFRALRLLPWFGGSLSVASAAKVFDDHGALTDESVRKQLGEFVNGFAAFVLATKKQRA